MIAQRLQIKKPDVVPDDGYEFEDIHQAAMFVFSAGSRLQFDDESVKQESKEQGSINELLQAVSSLTRVLTVSAQAPQVPPPLPSSSRIAHSFPTPGGVAQNPPPSGASLTQIYTSRTACSVVLRITSFAIVP